MQLCSRVWTNGGQSRSVDGSLMIQEGSLDFHNCSLTGGWASEEEFSNSSDGRKRQIYVVWRHDGFEETTFESRQAQVPWIHVADGAMSIGFGRTRSCSRMQSRRCDERVVRDCGWLLAVVLQAHVSQPLQLGFSMTLIRSFVSKHAMCNSSRSLLQSSRH